MRHVVAYMLVSLDGVAEGPDQFVFDFDEVMDDNLRRVIDAQDTVLLGHRMYDEWSAYWPTSDHEPFATFINSVPKYVAASRPFTPDWADTTVVDGSFEDCVRDLKGTEGGDIGVHGSLALTRSLLAADLVDQLRLVVTPVAVGEGRRLWDGVRDVQRWELEQVVGAPTGSLLVDYRRSGA
ncbi:dihydrofolate reductase family protein [Mumia sp. ZJ1417]|uniref:dihydrofolate reductase family protein n=1 Tax=unclassified Mumia TaxID=2621872 RepID=UPI00141F9FC3|nr:MULTISPECIES: dihydrofolate reductase family protein [unclassified Mumia]QMW67373.1 dihydrofolate reductase family protein [Mumia sp. ZJ1417]